LDGWPLEKSLKLKYFTASLHDFIIVKKISDSKNSASKKWSLLDGNIKGLQINLYLEQPMKIQLFATFFQRRK
jgi:hypothetical protein